MTKDKVGRFRRRYQRNTKGMRRKAQLMVAERAKSNYRLEL